jgi:anti-sigma regulatory factor (Ser/Thr protein kinase)
MTPNRHDRGEIAFQLARSLSAPSDARDRVGGYLDRLGVASELRNDVLLALSELVTNAVTHARAAPRVHVDVAGGTLRVEVHDTSLERPVKQSSGSSAGGFGVRLVSEVADSWGWEQVHDGKVVWAQFDVGDGPRPPDGSGAR